MSIATWLQQLFGKHMPLRRNHPVPFVPGLEVLEERVVLDDSSAGEFGIMARDLRMADGIRRLNGANIAIGQIEIGRPGVPGFDNAANSHADVEPTGVYRVNGAATANRADELRPHALAVAGVMIANGAANKGVAPEAHLYSSAQPTLAAPAHILYALDAMAFQHVAIQNGGDVRAINLSSAVPSIGRLDGTGLETALIDWSART